MLCEKNSSLRALSLPIIHNVSFIDIREKTMTEQEAITLKTSLSKLSTRNIGKCMNDAIFLLNDLQENGPQASWDWPADMRFAQHVGDTDTAQLLEWAIHSQTVLPVLIATVKLHGEWVKQRRLRALRLLAHMGKVQAKWDGMGERGVHDFGVSRTRVYYLSDAVPCQIR